MSRYAKFLKELLMNKRKLEEVPSVTLSKECSALITNKLFKKKKDPRGFIVPCTIGGLVNEKALADLGASINLIPYKIFQKLGLGEPKPTAMILQLTDRSIRQPRGIIEDILVKVDDVFSTSSQVEVSLILERPFLATLMAFIDVKDGRITLRVGEEEVVFKLRDSMRHTMDFDDTCYFIDVIDGVISEFVQDTFLKDKLSELLEDDPVDDEAGEEVMIESYYL
ncbi:uncharacterized protein LOC120282785 [Dioscorea cayenensis subsp. rotundata]|uniref:Uncharacterized protein LOC120282785 n=1 Tax=Dioscorea cayennensis subsp. rotundata TaxID=55577 RepID=A0AB40CZM6_DIOCR|nr:uncharacterized protein LOC120282785 [Dioscorea cayenensis subsp. rotundata]